MSDESTMNENQAAGGRLFPKRDDALDYLKARGWKIGRTKFHADCKKGLIPTNQGGQFEEAVILAYAASLPTVAREEDLETSNASRDRLAADTELKQFQAKRQKLKLEKEQGLLMPRADHERDLAVRAQLFRNEREGECRRQAPKIVEWVIGKLAAQADIPTEVAVILRDAAANLVPELTEYLLRESEDLMDAWSADREFVVDLGDDSTPGAFPEIE